MKKYMCYLSHLVLGILLWQPERKHRVPIFLDVCVHTYFQVSSPSVRRAVMKRTAWHKVHTHHGWAMATVATTPISLSVNSHLVILACSMQLKIKEQPHRINSDTG